MALYTVPIATETSSFPVTKYAVTILTTIQIILHVHDFMIDLFLDSVIALIPNHIDIKFCM